MGDFFPRALLAGFLFLITSALGAQPPQRFDLPSTLAAVDRGMAPYTYPTTGMSAPVPGTGPALGWQMPANRTETWVSQPPANQLPQMDGEALMPEQVDATVDGNALAPWDDSCGECGTFPCDPCCQSYCDPGWSVAASGLFFTRGRPNFYQLTFNTDDLTSAPLSSQTGTGNWDAGPEIRFTWPLDGGRSFEAVYWGIYGDNEEDTVYESEVSGNLNTTLDLTLLTIDGANVNDLYDGASAHRLRRHYDIHNIELNLLSGNLPTYGWQNLQVGYLAGFRYFRLAEEFEYASAFADPVFGNDPGNEAYYNIDLENHLLGFQLGARADWYLRPKLSIYSSVKFGIYDNYIEHRSLISNVNGTAIFIPNLPISGQEFDIVSNTNVAATIGELDLGIRYRLGWQWSAALGYRAVGVSGIAIPTTQVPSTGRMPGVEGIDHSSTMLLHGGYASIEFGW